MQTTAMTASELLDSIRGTKMEILSHDWKISENGNEYCQLVVKPKDDPFASTMKYNFFVSGDEAKLALDKNFPKEINLASVRVPIALIGGQPHYRFWPDIVEGRITDDDNRICTYDPQTSQIIPIVFDTIPVVIRCGKDLKPAYNEDPIKIATRQYNSALRNNTIELIEGSENNNDDAFNNVQSYEEDDDLNAGNGNGNPQSGQPPVQYGNQHQQNQGNNRRDNFRR